MGTAGEGTARAKRAPFRSPPRPPSSLEAKELGELALSLPSHWTVGLELGGQVVLLHDSDRYSRVVLGWAVDKRRRLLRPWRWSPLS